MTGAYYNDNDPLVCAWLRELIKAGLIAPGEVDNRSIKDVRADDLKGFTQHHFFAGIGGWSYALRLAGWPDDQPVWTGSCPCQPYSQAGKGLAEKDPRHLWPDWFRLIDQLRPATVFGEQVVSPAARRWLSGVRADLETLGYAVGGADLCAAGVGAPQIRQRLWWVSYAPGNQNWTREPGSNVQPQLPAGGHDSACGIPNSPGGGYAKRPGPSVESREAGCNPYGEARPKDVGELPGGSQGPGATGRLSHPGSRGRRQEITRESREKGPAEQNRDDLAGYISPGGLLNTERGGRPARGPTTEAQPPAEQPGAGYIAGPGHNPWDEFDVLGFADGKARRVEPGTFPLAHGLSGRMAVVRTIKQSGTEVQETRWYNRACALKGFGNAINPQTAATFIRAAGMIDRRNNG